MKHVIPWLAICLLTGCASVPKTQFTINPSTGTVTVNSRKDVEFSGLDATIGGNAVKIKSYKSKNSPDVISAVANANLQMAAQLQAITADLRAIAAKMNGGL